MKKIRSLINFIDHIRKPLIIAGLVLNVSLGFLYAYYINSTIHHAVTIGKVQSELAAESTHVADLESRYMQLTSAITLDFAYTQGYVDASTRQTYISEKSLSPTLSFNAL